MFWLSAAKWIGTGAGVTGAIMIALNLGLVIYGFGLFLISSLLWSAVGWVQRGILRIAPWLMKFLSIAGTAAMFLVGGGILTHNVPALRFAVEEIPSHGVFGTVLGMLADLVVGVIAGSIVLGVVKFIGKVAAQAGRSGNK